MGTLSAAAGPDVRVLLVDAANVVGTRPDGWWKDRPGAAAALVSRLAAWSAAPDALPVVVVLEGQARAGVAQGRVGRVQVHHASGAGDDALLQGCRPGVLLVTADRALATAARERGSSVTGPKWLLDRLDAGPAGTEGS